MRKRSQDVDIKSKVLQDQQHPRLFLTHSTYWVTLLTEDTSKLLLTLNRKQKTEWKKDTKSQLMNQWDFGGLTEEIRVRGYKQGQGWLKNSCITKTHSIMGDVSKKLETWRALCSPQAAPQVGKCPPQPLLGSSALLGVNCLFSLYLLIDRES